MINKIPNIVAANLAIAFARNGLRTALVYADIYDPSIPEMFRIENERPDATARANTINY